MADSTIKPSDEKPLGPCGFCGALAEVKCSTCKSVYYCDRNCQKRHWKQHKTGCKQIKSEAEIIIVEPLDAVDVSNLTLKVEVRKKGNGTLGVFTTDYIKKGEPICYYDGETKDANKRIRMRKLAGSSMISIVDSEEVFANLFTDVKCLAHPKKPGYVKIASENQKEFGIGQWICDFTKPQFQQNEFSAATEELHSYQTLSLKKSNCQVNESFWFSANSNLEANTELFVHYGFQYWLKKLMLEEKDNPEKRFLLYSLHDQSTQIFNLQKFYEYDDATCLAFLKTLIQMPQEKIDSHPNVKEFLFELTMKNIDQIEQI